MTDGTPPGLTGPVGTPAQAVRAPKAWFALVHTQFVAVPNAIRESGRARARMRRLRKSVRR